MPIPLEAPLAPQIVLVGGYVLRLTALSATTGAVVAGVTVSDVSLQVDMADAPEPEVKLPALPPVLAYGPGAV